MMPEKISRRMFLAGTAACGTLMIPGLTLASQSPERKIALRNLHTGEKLKVAYWADGHYLKEGLAEINHLLRDHRSGESYGMDKDLMDLLYALDLKMGGGKEFHIISGYRSPKTNAKLRKASNGVAKRSLHMQGRAIDIRMPGRRLTSLHKAAKSLKMGGVGLYTKSDFIHVDTGRVRYW